MAMKDRKTLYPDRYRVCFRTVAGLMMSDHRSESKARAAAKSVNGYVLAQWYCTDENGRTYIDSEHLPGT